MCPNQIPEHAYVMLSDEMQDMESVRWSWLFFTLNHCWYPVIQAHEASDLDGFITEDFFGDGFQIVRHGSFQGKEIQSAFTEALAADSCS